MEELPEAVLNFSSSETYVGNEEFVVLSAVITVF
jgi:hypothetical protein